MLRSVLLLLGVDLDRILAEIRSQVAEWTQGISHRLSSQLKETSLTVGFAFIGAVAAITTFIIALETLYRWVDLYKGPFAALAAVGTVTGLVAAVMFVLAFWHGPRTPASAGVGRHPAASPLPRPPSPPLSAALSAALPPPPTNASALDILKHQFSTRVAGAGDEAVDAAVHEMRTGSRSVLFGTLAVMALVGVMLGRRP